jgi:hypothetical protein
MSENQFVPLPTVESGLSNPSLKPLQRKKTAQQMVSAVVNAPARFAKQEMDRVNVNIGNVKANRFNRWKQEELVDLLISQNIELRSEETIPISTLRELVEELYTGRPMPVPIPPYTDKEFEEATRAAQRLQNIWIKRQALRRWQKSQEELLSQK